MPQQILGSVIDCTHLHAAGRGFLSALQVKMPDGSWTDVDTSPDEAAVFLGAATEQATAGLLKAATYRVVRPMLLLALCT